MTLPGLPVSAQAAFAAALVDEWERAGLTDAVIAPGSRSTPLTLALAASSLRTHVHVDERSAGFFALGLALASGRPAPVVTTSGTAAGHLVPAVMEAHHACVPMLLCTADRPPGLHHVGAPQTTEQEDLFAGFVRLRLSVDASLPPRTWRSIASRVVSLEAGPVHLNLRFDDPLVAVPGDLVPPGRADGRPWHVVSRPGPALVPISTRVSGRTGVIVATAGIADPGLVVEAATVLGWPILAGPRSGCRGSSPLVVSAFDAVLRGRDTPRPDVVLRFGGLPASRVANDWLDGLEAEQVVADPLGQWIDPGRTASEVMVASPEAVCRSVLGMGPVPAPDGWASTWRAMETAAQQTIAKVLGARADLTEPGVARVLTRTLPASTTLLVASSMPIRDVEAYGDPAMACRVVANRGVNGIDGLVSTALGLAVTGPTVALLGDLAFLHDIGGLLFAAGRDVDCTFVVVDNDGGGIFSFLPQSGLDPDTFERFWGTPHGVDVGALAEAYGIPVAGAGSAAALEEALSPAERGVRVVVVRTDRAGNVAVHDELVAALGS